MGRNWQVGCLQREVLLIFFIFEFFFINKLFWHLKPVSSSLIIFKRRQLISPKCSNADQKQPRLIHSSTDERKHIFIWGEMSF